MSEINKESVNILEENMEKLRNIFPNIFSEGKIDFKKLKETLGDFVDSNDEKYTFSWAGRSESLQNLQTTPRGTLIPQQDESVNFDETENIFIEGENLEVLKLLQKSYTGKVKMIYIDPPYNTGNDFIYKDDFSNPLQSYLEQTGQVSSGIKLSTNLETSGRFHSDWISFMYARLFVSKNLLRNDGIIFVSIDDNEIHNLKLIMNDIYGEENFLGCIIWQHSIQPKGYLGKFSVHHNYLLCYQKSDSFSLEALERTEEHNKNYSNPDNDPKGSWRTGDVRNSLFRKNLIFDITTPAGKIISPPKNGWRWSKETINKKIQDGEIIFNKDETRIIRKIYLKDVGGRTPETIWFGKDVGTTREASQEIKELFDGVSIFDTPKPTKFLKRMLQMSTEKSSDDLILDFFGGSCSLAHAVLEYNIEDNGNRRFITVQIPEECKNDSDASKQGFKNISEIGKERIRRVIKKIKEKNKQQKLTEINPNLGFKVFKLAKSNYKIWEDVKDEEKLKDQLKLFEDPLVENYKDIDVIYEIIIKEGYSLNSKIELFQEKPNKIYKVQDGEFFFYVTLDKTLDQKAIQSINLTENTMFVCLDSALDDSDKINLEKQCKLRVI